MKKLMVMAAVVCAAIASQAASIGWSTSSAAYCDSTGTPATSFTGGQVVLVIMESATDWANAVEVATASSAGTKNTTTVSINQTTSKAGRLSGTVTFTYTAGEDNFIENGDYLALMWKDSEGTLAQLVYADESPVAAVYQVSGLSNNASALTGKTIPIGNNTKFMAPAPEPTSAMLLLLGMAGLALRRKQK